MWPRCPAMRPAASSAGGRAPEDPRLLRIGRLSVPGARWPLATCRPRARATRQPLAACPADGSAQALPRVDRHRVALVGRQALRDLLVVVPEALIVDVHLTEAGIRRGVRSPELADRTVVPFDLRLDLRVVRWLPGHHELGHPDHPGGHLPLPGFELLRRERAGYPL